MSDKSELKSIIQFPHEAAQQMILELIKSGAYNSPPYRAEKIREEFDTLHKHFESVKKELTGE